MRVADAIEEAIDFMETFAPGEVLSLDEFLSEYNDMLTTEEKAYGEFLYNTIMGDYPSCDCKDILIQFIKEYPNDAKLGEMVRKLYNKS